MARPSNNRRTAALVTAIFFASPLAAAEAPRLETHSNVDGCPSTADLRQAIATQVGRDDFDRPDAPRVVVRIRHTADDSLAAEVAMTARDGSTSTRTIDGADTCNDLVRAAALTIALAIEKDAAEPKRKAAPPPLDPPPMTTKDAENDSRELVRKDRIVMTASALTSVGLLPRPAAGGGLGARVRVSESAWLSARGFWLPEASMPNDSFSMSLFAAGAGACIEPFGSTNVSAVGCAHVLFGSLNVTQANVDMVSSAPAPYVAATLAAGARARVHGPLHVEGAVDAQMPFTRPTFLTTTCPPTGFEPPFVGLAIWLGAGVSIR